MRQVLRQLESWESKKMMRLLSKVQVFPEIGQRFVAHLEIKAARTSSLRPHTLVAYGLIHE